ncbi:MULTISPECIES: hypothetical protein [Vibrio]|uniref:hypothetical protein n=1 Tax=Vibrio TaxID=662 RepID=UPI000587161C|nr:MULTISPECIES: hypothetical protein [Vibrio]MCM5511267.1 hypothetical protein [Vibrio sp. SCSIO 43169]MDE3899255.1 hypothetical protein [Vibrio sp. CC007]QFT35869.1 hypothetical protein FIU99_05470 [Vibrio sp. THAF64]QGM33769.1 hypothetical protein GGC04_05480 [Vibrio sp. THAF191d]QGN69272.1 hypothetical protein GGC03_05480 [Vibrio sp. THAF191c]
MKKSVLLTLVSAVVMIQGCTRNVINQTELAQVKKVAVVMYSVPETIVRDVRDPEDISEDKQVMAFDALSMASQLLDGSAKKVVNMMDSTSHVQKQIDGQEAADISLVAMLSELSDETGWQYLTPQQVADNTEYQQLSLKLASSQHMTMERSIRRHAAVPAGYVNLGLPHGHAEVMSYQDREEFKLWASKVARALNVDAVILVSDTGYATDSKSLLIGGGCYTKSAMHYAMYNVNGEQIVDTRVSFSEAPMIEQSGCVDGSFFKSDYKGALVEHGQEQGRKIAEKLRS